MECHDVQARKRCTDPRLAETVGSVCPKDEEEQMRLHEIGENYENLKAKVVSYTTNETEQTRRQKQMYAPMEVDNVSGSEPEEEDVDEVRRGSVCYYCGGDGTLRKRLWKEGQGQRERRRRREGIRQRKRENDARHGKVRFRQIWMIQGRTERLVIPTTVLDARQGRTQGNRMSMKSRRRR